jgi:hypothetical protein
MRIIDLDSLVLFADWTCPEKKDPRYISQTPHLTLPGLRTALEFLFYQVAVLSDAWLGEIWEGHANTARIIAGNEMIGEWSSGCPRETCDASYILEKMGEIGAKFGVAAEPDATACIRCFPS